MRRSQAPSQRQKGFSAPRQVDLSHTFMIALFLAILLIEKRQSTTELILSFLDCFESDGHTILSSFILDSIVVFESSSGSSRVETSALSICSCDGRRCSAA